MIFILNDALIAGARRIFISNQTLDMMKLLFPVLIFAVLISTSYGAADVRDCDKSPPYYPKTVVHTTDRLLKLREQMKLKNLDAYIILSTDAHGSEYVRERDKRRGYISGFDGSAGTAVVTMKNGSALWTDGRYFLQGEKQLDCNWIFQKSGSKGVPTAREWLKSILQSGARVGTDPFLIDIRHWDICFKDFMKENITLVGVRENLVDKIWTDRPAEVNKTVDVQLHKYTGKLWYDKVKEVQEEMKKVKATAHVVQELDSIAWLLNLRGAEISYNPVFFAYVIVKTDGVLFFVNEFKISTMDVQRHLQLSTCKNQKYCITRKPYDSIDEELKMLSNDSDAKIWLSPKDHHALRLDIPEKKVYLEYSPIRLMKGKKNEVEMKGMRNANLKDSVALSEFFLYAEKQVAKNAKVTELSLEKKMEEFRSKQALYKGLSFASIVGFGPNGAVIHYRASNDTNRRVFDNSTLLVDTGSQYLDGSTDVTRTVHFGTPTPKQKSAFTRVLMGQIDLAMAVFPEGTYGRAVDIFARLPLFKNGWNYRHGTGHGIGSYLYIHEGPGRIAAGNPLPYEKPLEIGFVLSDEPGYYEPGNFGIRLETAVVVVNASTPNRFNDVDYYTFEPICYFPVQRKLIDETLLSERQVKWINDYHAKTEKLVGDELKRQKKMEEYEWLKKQIKQIDKKVSSDATTTVLSISITFITAIITTLFA